MPDNMFDTAPLSDKDSFVVDESTQAITPIDVPELVIPDSVLMVFADNPNALYFVLTGELVLGRRSESDERPDVDLAPYGAFPAGLSRRHCLLRRTSEGIELVDLGSRNGTYVDEEKLDTGRVVSLSNGQALRMGHLLGWIYFEPPA